MKAMSEINVSCASHNWKLDFRYCLFLVIQYRFLSLSCAHLILIIEIHPWENNLLFRVRLKGCLGVPLNFSCRLIFQILRIRRWEFSLNFDYTLVRRMSIKSVNFRDNHEIKLREYFTVSKKKNPTTLH